jgi:zinc transporter ZupT
MFRAVIDESVNYLTDSVKDGDFLKSLTFAFAMSFHSVLEGFALGVQNEKAGIMTLFLSLIIHKGIEAFSVGLQVSRSNRKRLVLVIATILVYSLMTPVGSMIGVFLAVSLILNKKQKKFNVFV